MKKRFFFLLLAMMMMTMKFFPSFGARFFFSFFFLFFFFFFLFLFCHQRGGDVTEMMIRGSDELDQKRSLKTRGALCGVLYNESTRIFLRHNTRESTTHRTTTNNNTTNNTTRRREREFAHHRIISVARRKFASFTFTLRSIGTTRARNFLPLKLNE